MKKYYIHLFLTNVIICLQFNKETAINLAQVLSVSSRLSRKGRVNVPWRSFLVGSLQSAHFVAFEGGFDLFCD